MRHCLCILVPRKQFLEVYHAYRTMENNGDRIADRKNVLVRDKGIRGIVIKLGNMLRHFYEAEDMLVFGSGYSLALASYKAMECEKTGMEFAVGIPGSIGGAVYMNAYAFNGEITIFNLHA